jgi:hypothetical protein
VRGMLLLVRSRLMERIGGIIRALGGEQKEREEQTVGTKTREENQQHSWICSYPKQNQKRDMHRYLQPEAGRSYEQSGITQIWLNKRRRRTSQPNKQKSNFY